MEFLIHFLHAVIGFAVGSLIMEAALFFFRKKKLPKIFK